LTKDVQHGDAVSFTPKIRLVDQASAFMSPGDRVVQLNLQTLGVQFYFLLPHPWTTMGPPHEKKKMKKKLYIVF
jgi:hypothetical protein